MTGFARADGTGEALRWTWELRSVNGKALDIRLRLPPGYEEIEAGARERLGKALGRGSVQASLTVQAEAGAARVRINEVVLAEIMRAMEAISDRFNVQAPTLDGLLSVRGVLETIEPDADEDSRARRAAVLFSGLDAALADLVANRSREGAAIGAFLNAQIDEIERLVAAADASPARTPEAIRAKLAEQVETLLATSGTFDPDRLHQEAVLLATRADIREELDRLTAHVGAARALMAEDAPIGRRLDFLAQEFNREVNTLCAKANDRALTAIGLDLKAVVDQFREQIQNLE